ncbi:MAG: hypothetical protein ACLFQ5_02790 [Oceanicaulis sp.]
MREPTTVSVSRSSTPSACSRAVSPASVFTGSVACVQPGADSAPAASSVAVTPATWVLSLVMVRLLDRPARLGVVADGSP